MDFIIRLLGIDSNTCRDRQLQPVLLCIGIMFSLVIIFTGLSIFLFAKHFYSILIALPISVFLIFFMFHIFRLIFIVATTDRLPTREEIAVRNQIVSDSNRTIKNLILTLSIKYFILSILGFLCSSIMFYHCMYLIDKTLYWELNNSDFGMIDSLIHLFKNTKIINWFVFLACLFFILSPALITDINLNKRLIKQNYRRINIRPIIRDRISTEASINSQFRQKIEFDLSYYQDPDFIRRNPSISNSMVAFINNLKINK